jgi:hypothetical protein
LPKSPKLPKIAEKEELTAKDAKESKEGDARTRSRGSMQSFDGMNGHSIDFTRPSSCRNRRVETRGLIPVAKKLKASVANYKEGKSP